MISREKSVKLFYNSQYPKKNVGVWDLMPELTITSPYVDSRVDSNTSTY